MSKKFNPVIMFFIGLIIGIIASIMIVEKQLWFWHVKKDRGFLILEVRKINLEKEEIDDLIRKLKGYMKEVDRALGKGVEK